jgi:hypothetical protein
VPDTGLPTGIQTTGDPMTPARTVPDTGNDPRHQASDPADGTDVPRTDQMTR